MSHFVALQDELNGIVADAKPIRSRLGIESTGARSAAAAEAARVLPGPLLCAFTLLSAAVRSYDMRATVTVTGMCPWPRCKCPWPQCKCPWPQYKA